MNPLQKYLGLAILVCIPGITQAQSDLIGPDEYPQFRGVSGLPGGGFPVRPESGIGLGGAFALSTPVAYSLGHYEFFAGGSMLSTGSNIPPFSGGGGNGGDLFSANSTLWQMVGVKAGKVGWLTVSNMIVSSKRDNGTNYHFKFNIPNSKIGIAVGIQDIGGQIGSAGDIYKQADTKLSRSAYVVGTTPLGDRSYLSLGIGTRRFFKPFGSVSTWLTPRLGAFAEYEGREWNVGGLYGLGKFRFLKDRPAESFTSFGIVDGKYPYWSIGMKF